MPANRPVNTYQLTLTKFLEIYPRIAGGADNVNITPGSGVVIATRDVGSGVEAQRVIVNSFLSGVATDTSIDAPLPVANYPRLLSWSATPAVPATTVQATITKAAGGSGVKHVATAITASYAGGASAISAAAPMVVNLRDGTTGAGTILWSTQMNVAAAAAASQIVHITGLLIVGTANTAMTLEFLAGGGTNSYQMVSLQGFDYS